MSARDAHGLTPRNTRPGTAEDASTADSSLEGSPLLADAYAFARAAHAGQHRETDGAPYIEHPLAVARLLRLAGFEDEVVAAGLLHDTVEDSGATLAQIEERFGSGVARLVAAMTEPEDVEPFEARKAAHRERIAGAGYQAEAIFAADKVVNARDLREAIARIGESALERRLGNPLERKVDHYRATLRLLDDVAATLPLVRVLRDELERLAAERERRRR